MAQYALNLPPAAHSPLPTWKVLLTSALLAFSAPSSSNSKPVSTNAINGAVGRTFAPSNYSIVPGLFIQSDPSFNSTGYDLLQDSFGLIDKTADRWSKFKSTIAHLNAQADEFTAYKVVMIARHGQGYHNVAEEKYGTREWNCYWSELTTDGNLTWGPDALLSPLGTSQAQSVNSAWKDQLRAGVPLPASLYSSPLSRAAATLEITWEDILLSEGVRPLVKENLRESIGLHTCDKRSRKSELVSRFPNFDFEPSFTEHDQLWSPTYQESPLQHSLRTQQVLNEIFATDPNTYISITSHGGTIASFLQVVNHPQVFVGPGAFVPVVVKAVSYLEASNTVLAGGQSIARPECTSSLSLRRIRNRG